MWVRFIGTIVSSMASFISVLHSLPWNEYTIIYVSVPLLRDIWVVSSYYASCCCEHSGMSSPCLLVNKCTHLLGGWLGGKLLGVGPSVGSTSGDADSSPQRRPCAPPRSARSSRGSASHQHVYRLFHFCHSGGGVAILLLIGNHPTPGIPKPLRPFCLFFLWDLSSSNLLHALLFSFIVS